MKPIDYHPGARAELFSAVRYYNSQQHLLGLDLLDEVDQVLARIRQKPKSFSYHRTKKKRKALVHRFPYSIYYHEQRSLIRIVAVAHQSRKPDYWIRRK